MARSILLLASILLLTVSGGSDEGEHPEDLTAEQLGTVHFPISCAPSAQEPFTRGVALLHSFWYDEAGKAFSQGAKDDPRSRITQWGVDMSLCHQRWNRPDSPTIKRGAAEVKKAKSLPAKNNRERDYIAAAGAFFGG